MKYIKGVGMTDFGLFNKPSHLLAYDAAIKALNDANLKINEIDAIVSSNLNYGAGEANRHFQSHLSSLFKTNIPIINTPAACASGSVALWSANNLDFDNILVLGGEKLSNMQTHQITTEFAMALSEIEKNAGLNFPSVYALVCQAYMNNNPQTNMGHLSKIALKNHNNANLNPKAFFHKKQVTLDKINSSKIISSPLRLYDCSVSVDAGASLVISKDKSDISLNACELNTDNISIFDRDDITDYKAVKLSSKNAFEQSKISPSQIHIAELHDAFTIAELICYEHIGFAEKGKAFEKIEDNYFSLNGKIPINTSGGLKAKGHPVSVTGLSQIYELVKQLRNEAEDRQVNCKNALAQNIGGTGGTVVTSILKKT